MSLAGFGRDMLAEMTRTAKKVVAREGTHLRWATVTDIDPVRIRYDGEANPSIVPPDSVEAGLIVGDRVAVVKQHGQALIVGKAGGGRVLADRIVGTIDRDRLPFRVAAGVAPITGTGSSFVSATITLPAGTFNATPVVTATARNSKMNAYYSDAGMSPTSIRVGWRHTDDANFSSTFNVSWIAVET